ncbi:hypothetical protein JTB14_018942 [Gonioctena quinquepunctata]|nr:hypothetical protein JTB14_018942 [Gonioctena quinquepunctata]
MGRINMYAVPGVKNAKYLGACHIIRKNLFLCSAEHPERQPVASRDILRVSRLLEVAQGRNEEDKENSSDGSSEDEEPVNTTRKKRSISPYGSVKRRRWTTDETATALNEFAKNIESGKLPSLKEIQEVKSKCPHLNQRSSPRIKTWIHNQFKKHGGI